MTITYCRRKPIKEACDGAHIIKLWEPRPQKRNEITRDEKAQKRICALYKEGYTLRELANWFLTSYETIRTILKNAEVLRRPAHNDWKPEIGRETIVGGYKKVYVGIGYPGAPRNGWMLKHRLVVQKRLNRVLFPWEIVHHKDRNKLNDDDSNLGVVSRQDHPSCIGCPYYQFYVEQTGNTHLTTQF